jgi:hypothetical protein
LSHCQSILEDGFRALADYNSRLEHVEVNLFGKNILLCCCGGGRRCPFSKFFEHIKIRKKI